MALKLDKRKVGKVIGGTLQIAFVGGLASLAIAGLRGCAIEEERTQEVTEAIDKAYSAAEGQRSITITDGDVVTFNHGAITNDYNFYSRQMLVGKNGEVQVFLFNQLDTAHVDEVRTTGCVKARSIRGELARVSSEDANEEAALSLTEAQQNAGDFMTRHCNNRQPAGA